MGKVSVKKVCKPNLVMKSGNVEQPPRMTPDELRLLRSMVHEQNKTPTEVAGILQRDLSVVCRQLKKTRSVKMGRPAKFSEKQVEKLVDTVEDMVNDADAN